MGTVNVEWVRFGAGVYDNAAQNCIAHTVKTEQITTSGSNAQSGACPDGANGAIVYAVEDHYVSFEVGNTDPDATGTERMRLLATKETVFAGMTGGEKIAAITV